MKRLARLVEARRRLRRRRHAFAPRLLIFDFDGTIGDTFEAGFEILNSLAREFGFRELAREDLPLARDMRTRELMKFLGLRSSQLPKLARRGTEELAARIHSVEPLSGIPEVLRELHGRGFRLGIVTSNSEANVRAFLIRHQLELFDFVRPSSKLLGKARKAAGFKRHEVLFIGDETRDIEACRKAGVRVAAAAWGYNSARALQKLEPDFFLERPADLLALARVPGSAPILTPRQPSD
ncbi:MAG: HAD-IA family hydrolase [Terrimicrobiaceae bacterium]|nr:HAD-IA family hydrolase [Terrimicrobiaceae bacterium]